MKRLAAVGIVYLISLCSCSVDLPDRDISADRKELVFPSKGGTEVICVSTAGPVWDAYSTSSWIEIVEKDVENGKLTVRTEPTEEISDLSGNIVLHSDMEEVLKIRVVQKGNGVIYDRSSLSIMNLHGKVRECSFYFDPTYIWEMNPTYLKNLRFDANGMVTHMEYFDHADLESIDYSADIVWDGERRLSRIEATAPSYGITFSIDFSYADHGKYIETDRLFSYIEGTCWCCSRMWMPRMIKDLSSIKIHNSFATEKNKEIVINVNGDIGTAVLKYGETEMQLYLYTFENGFTRTVDFQWGLEGIAVDGRYTYELDSDGYIKRLIWNSAVFGNLPVMEKRYGNDLCNLLSDYTEFLNFGYALSISRNENGDIISIMDAGAWGFYADYSYNYDQNGNWISVSVSDLGPYNETIPVEKERKIVYY